MAFDDFLTQLFAAIAALAALIAAITGVLTLRDTRRTGRQLEFAQQPRIWVEIEPTMDPAGAHHGSVQIWNRSNMTLKVTSVRLVGPKGVEFAPSAYIDDTRKVPDQRRRGVRLDGDWLSEEILDEEGRSRKTTLFFFPGTAAGREEPAVMEFVFEELDGKRKRHPIPARSNTVRWGSKQ